MLSNEMEQNFRSNDKYLLEMRALLERDINPTGFHFAPRISIKGNPEN